VKSKTDRIAAIVMPPIPWGPSHSTFRKNIEPDPTEIYRFMKSEGIDVEILDVNSKFCNPLRGSHPLFMGIDPVRAVTLLSCRRSVDIVISVFESPCLIPTILSPLLRYRPLLAMWDIAPAPEWKIRSRIQDWVVPRVDHLFLLSSGQLPYVDRQWGAGSKSSIILQHIDTNFFQPNHSDNRGYILSVGDDESRDFDTLIDAAAEIPVQILLKTRRALKNVNSERMITQVAARLSALEFRQLYAHSDLVVVPLRPTFNVGGVSTVLEAMAMGKPLIVSDTAPIRDFVRNGETAILVPPSDPRALREAIIMLRKDTAKRTALGESARIAATKLFSNEAFAKRYSAQIRSLVSNSAHKTAPM